MSDEPDRTIAEEEDPNAAYVQNFRSFLDDKRPAFDAIAHSDWWDDQPEQAKKRLKLEYWSWVKSQPEFKGIDQKAYKDYIFKQGFLDQQGRALGGAFMEGAGSGGQLLGKVFNKLNPVLLPVTLATQTTKLLNPPTDELPIDVISGALREGGKEASRIGQRMQVTNRPESNIAEGILKTESGVVRGATELWKYMAATMAGGPIAGFAGLGMLEEIDPDIPPQDQWKKVLEAGLSAAAMGAVFKWAEPLKPLVKSLVVGGYGAAVTKANGGTYTDSIAQGTSLVLLSAASPRNKNAELGFVEKIGADIQAAKHVYRKVTNASAELRAKASNLAGRMKAGEAKEEEFSSFVDDVKNEILTDPETTAEIGKEFDSAITNNLTNRPVKEVLDAAVSADTHEQTAKQEFIQEAKRKATNQYVEELPAGVSDTMSGVLKSLGAEAADIEPVMLTEMERLAVLNEGQPELVIEALGIDTGWSTRTAENMLMDMGVPASEQRVSKVARLISEQKIAPEDVSSPTDTSLLTVVDRSRIRDYIDRPGNELDPTIRKALDKASRGVRVPGKYAKSVLDVVDSFRADARADIRGRLKGTKEAEGDYIPSTMMDTSAVSEDVAMNAFDTTVEKTVNHVRGNVIPADNVIMVVDPETASGSLQLPDTPIGRGASTRPITVKRRGELEDSLKQNLDTARSAGDSPIAPDTVVELGGMDILTGEEGYLNKETVGHERPFYALEADKQVDVPVHGERRMAPVAVIAPVERILPGKAGKGKVRIDPDTPTSELLYMLGDDPRVYTRDEARAAIEQRNAVAAKHVDELAPASRAKHNVLVDVKPESRGPGGEPMVTAKSLENGNVIMPDGRSVSMEQYRAEFKRHRAQNPTVRKFRRVADAIRDGENVPDKILDQYPALKDMYEDELNAIRSIKDPSERAGAIRAIRARKALPRGYATKSKFMLAEMGDDGRVTVSDTRIFGSAIDAFNARGGEQVVIKVSPSRFPPGTTHTGDIKQTKDGTVLTLEQTPPPGSITKIWKNRKWHDIKVEESTDPIYRELDGDANRQQFSRANNDEPNHVTPDKAAYTTMVSRQDVVDAVNRKTLFSVRSGVEGEASGASYGNKVIYLSRSGDIGRLAHELAHGAEDVLQLRLDRYESMLKINGLQSSAEGFAEFSRLWWTNRKMAKSMFPEFYATFKSKFYGHNTELTKLYNIVDEYYSAYRNQPYFQQFMAQIEFDPHLRETRKASLKTVFGLEMTSQYYHVEQLAAKYRLSRPELEFIQKTLYVLAPQTDAAVMGIYGVEGYKPIDIDMVEHPEITPFSYFSNKYSDFSWKAYLKSGGEYGLVTNDSGMEFSAFMQALSVLHEGVDLSASQFFDTYSVTRQQAADMVRYVRSKPNGKSLEAEYLSDAKKLRQLFEFATDQLVDSGLISKEEADSRINKGYKFHAILNRVQSTIGSPTVFQPGNVAPDFFKVRHGSTEKIVGYLDAYRALIPKMMRTAFENVKQRKLAEFYRGLPDSEAFVKHIKPDSILESPSGDSGKVLSIIESVVDGSKDGINVKAVEELLETKRGHSWDLFDMQTSGDRYMKYYDDGKPVVHQILDPDTHAQMLYLKPEHYAEVNKFVKALHFIFSETASLSRVAFTKNPIFPLWNMPRDTATRMATTETGGLGLPTLRKAIKAIATNDPIVRQCLTDTNMMGFASRSRSSMDKALYRTKGSITDKVVAKYQAYHENMELVNRLAEYIGGVEKYGNTTEGRVKAAWDALDVTLNFRRMGKMGGKINQYVPFFNAGLQELSKIGRLLSDPRTRMRFVIKGLLTSALLQGTLDYVHHGKDWYDDRSKFLKATTYTIANVNGYTIFLPKPFAIGAIYSSIGELAAVPLTTGKLPTLKNMQSIAKRAWTPVVPNLSAPVPSAALELAMNLNRFMGIPIESKSDVDDNVPKRYRFNSYTPAFLVSLGPMLEKVNMSPAQADYAIQKFTGVMGRIFEDAVDGLYGNLGGDVAKPAPGREGWAAPFARFATPDYLRMSAPSSALAERIIKLAQLEKNLKNKEFGESYKKNESEKLPWLKNKDGRAVFAASFAARKEIFSLFGAKSFFMNARSMPIDEKTGKPSRYRVASQVAVLHKFFRQDDHFSEKQKLDIISAIRSGKQLDDVVLRRLVLSRLTRYVNTRSKYYTRALDDLMGE